MAKKNRQKLQQLIAKRQQLQTVQAGRPTTEQVVRPSVPPSPVTNQPTVVNLPPDNQPVASYSVGRELRRTVVSIGLIIILLGVSFWVDHKTTYFQTFGSWLFVHLRLNS